MSANKQEPSRRESVTLRLCTHGTMSGIVEFHEEDGDADPEACPPYGCMSLVIVRGEWVEMGTPAEIEVTITVHDDAPRVGDGRAYPGWTHPFSWEQPG